MRQDQQSVRRTPSLHDRVASSPTRFASDEVAEEDATEAVQFDDMVFLDPREERAVLRESYAEAARMAPKKKDVILVGVRGGCDRRTGRDARRRTGTSTRPSRCGRGVAAAS